LEQFVFVPTFGPATGMRVLDPPVTQVTRYDNGTGTGVSVPVTGWGKVLSSRSRFNRMPPVPPLNACGAPDFIRKLFVVLDRGKPRPDRWLIVARAIVDACEQGCPADELRTQFDAVYVSCNVHMLCSEWADDKKRKQQNRGHDRRPGVG
jgi:hypothetical protein